MGKLPDGFVTKRIWRNDGNRHLQYPTEEMIFDWSRPIDDFKGLAKDREAILSSAKFAYAVADPNEKRIEQAVYVIAVDGLPVSKIGVTTNPTLRLEQLQQSHWAGLSIYSLLWSPGRKAEKVEADALAAASEMGVRLRGEWVAMEPEEALETVLKSGRFNKAPLCDGSTWVKNWKLRLEALNKSRVERDRLKRHAGTHQFRPAEPLYG